MQFQKCASEEKMSEMQVFLVFRGCQQHSPMREEKY